MPAPAPPEIGAAAAAVRVEPLGPHFGARVRGPGLADALLRPASQPAGLWSALASLLTEHSLLLLRPAAGFGPAAEVEIKDRILEAMGVHPAPDSDEDDDEEQLAAARAAAALVVEELDGQSPAELERKRAGEGGGLFKKYSRPGVQNLRGAKVPGHPSLSLLGHGPVDDHYGLSGEMQQAPLGTGCHVNWHSDGAFHRRDQLPSRLLQFYCVRAPLLPDGAEALNWARGDGDRVPHQPGATSRRRDCHFTDIPSPSILKHLLKERGVHQNDSLADG